MEDKRKQILTLFAENLLLLDTLDDEEKNYNKELENIFLILPLIKNPIVEMPRLKNYVEEIIPTYNEEQFKSHFR